jgi:hypothetical protein
MKGRRFLTVFTVVLAVTLFTTFAFGQVKGGQRTSDAWQKQLDSITAYINATQEVVVNEMATSTCEEKTALYQEALNSLQDAFTYVSLAYDAYGAYLKTGKSYYLIYVSQYLTAAWAQVAVASNYLAQARDYTCPA